MGISIVMGVIELVVDEVVGMMMRCNEGIFEIRLGRR